MIFALNSSYRWERQDTLAHHVIRGCRAFSRAQIIW
ncbi:hypothetical protein EV687_3106 [Corticibacter populi]|nr:hypothetical protein EV687_3106 [Corticibacter populi]